MIKTGNVIKTGKGKGCGSVRTTEVEIKYSQVHDVRKYTADNNYIGNNTLKLCFFVNGMSIKNNFKIDELSNYMDVF